MSRFVTVYVLKESRFVPGQYRVETETTDELELALAIHREQKRPGLPADIERDRDGVLRWKRV